jgi:hypothetical protein
MGENLHDIDKLFRDAIDEHEEMPAGKVWDSIENNLDKSNIIQIKRRYNNFKRIAIVLILLLSATVIYQLQVKTKAPVKAGLVNNATGDKQTPAGNTGNKKEIVSNGDTEPVNTANEESSSNTAKEEINNAAKEDNFTVQQQQTGQVVTDNIPVVEKNKFNPRAKNISSKNGNEKYSAGNNDEAVLTKNPIKKSTARKTKIVVRNGRAEGMNEEDDRLSQENTSLNNTNELIALQKTKAEKLLHDGAGSTAEKISTRNMLPDVNVAVNTIKNKKDKHPFHFNIMPFYAPQYSFTRIVDNHASTVAPPPGNNRREEIKKSENHETAASFGVLIQVPVSKRWRIQTGITYLKKSIGIEPKKIFAKLESDGNVKYRFDCSSGYTFVSTKSTTTPAVGDSVSAVSSSNKLHYISVPLAVSYKFSAGKFDIMPTMGGGINFLAKQKIDTEVLQGSSKTSQTIKTIHGLKSSYYNALAAVAIDYNINKKIALNITPAANFALSAINKDAVVKSYPNSIGVAAGVKIKF